MATGKIYNISCDNNDKKLRCPKKYDAKCVIYKGQDLPDLDISNGEDVESIIEKLTLIVNNLIQRITELDLKVDAGFLEIQNLINTLTQIINGLTNRVDELENTFCDRVSNCSTIQNIEDNLNGLLNNFCDRVSDCIDAQWELVPNKSGCSTNCSTWSPWSSSSTSDGCGIKTFIDINPMSPTFGTERVELDPTQTCIGQGSSIPSTPTAQDCSCSSSEYVPVGDGCDEENALYGWGNFPDQNPNSPTYGQDNWQRRTSYDSTCNPPSLPAQGECMHCGSVTVEVGTPGGKGELGNWVLSDSIPSGWTFDPSTGCITAPLWSETNISTEVNVTVEAQILDPHNVGWTIRRKGSTYKTGTGDHTEQVPTTVSVKYTQKQYKEGTYYYCNSIVI